MGSRGGGMSKARWYVVAALALLTASVVVLDATGVIFGEEVEPVALPVVQPPAVSDAVPALAAASDLAPDDARRLARAVRQALADPALGPEVAAFVATPGGEVLLDDGAEQAGTPASTLKLLTALAVLDRLGPDAKITTAVVAGPEPDEVVLVGGGDATLRTLAPDTDAPRSASLEQLAGRTAAALRADGVRRIRLGYDDTLFTGPAVAPSWEPTYVSSGVVAPVTALMADQGLVDPYSGSLARESDPAAAAAAAFADQLRARGIRVRGSVDAVAAQAGSAPVAQVQSPPAAVLVERMLTDSDNQLAEALGRLAAAAGGDPASFDGAAATLVDVAADRGADLSDALVFDASGLSRDNLLPALALAAVLQQAVTDPSLRPVTEGLPVAALSGTLTDRFVDDPEAMGAGLVRGKTGTLTGVSAEAGLVLGCDGDVLVFAFMADSVPYDTESARTALDTAAAALASCP